MSRRKIGPTYSVITHENASGLARVYQDIDKIKQLSDVMNYSLVKIYIERIENELNKIEICLNS